MLAFVDSGLYFVLDENNFINPLLKVGIIQWRILTTLQTDRQR